MQNGQFSRCNLFPSQQSPVKVVVYNCMHVSIKKSEVSLPLGRGKSGYEIRRVLRRTPTAEVAILTLFRDEHICLLAFEKSLQISKVIWVRSAPFPVRKTVARAHLRQISKKDEGRRKLSKMLGSSPFKKPPRLGRLKRLAERTYPSTTKRVLNFSKLKPCFKFFKRLNRRIELNKIHLYFIMFQKFRWTVKFRGKTRPFNVLE